MAESRMTALEKAKLRRLELENEQLRAQHARHIEVYRDQAVELIELRAKLDLLREVANG
jgi:hypothetical protein